MKKTIIYLVIILSVFLLIGCDNIEQVDPDNEILQIHSLKLSQGELSPMLTAGVLEYEIEVPNECESLELFPQIEKDANIDIQKPDKLNVGNNVIKIVLTKEGSYKKATYKINVTRLPSDKCKLSSLSLGNNIKLSPEFSKDNYLYTAETDYYSNLEITAEAEDSDATIKIIGNENLQLGENTVTIRVISPSEIYSSEYIIKVNKISTTS